MTFTAFNPVDTLSLIDSRIALAIGAPRRNLELLRDRLVGEMIGDIDLILEAVAPTFELIMNNAGAEPLRVGYPEFLTMSEGLCASDIMIWAKWQHLVVDETVVMASGLLTTLLPAAAAGVELSEEELADTLVTVTTPTVLIAEFADGLMTREITYSDPRTAEITKVVPNELLTRAAARRELFP